MNQHPSGTFSGVLCIGFCCRVESVSEHCRVELHLVGDAVGTFLFKARVGAP